MELDDAFREIGDYGRGQILIFVTVCSIGQFPASWYIFAIVFLGASPDYRCRSVLDHAGGDDSLYLVTENNINNNRKSCDIIDSNNSSAICENGWVYSEEVYSSTIVSEWDLICDRAGYVEYSQTVLMVGIMVGAYITGYLTDRFGRKPVLFVALFVQGIAGVIQAYSSSFTMFVIIRFITGVIDQGYELPVYTMVSELFAPRCRPYAFLCMLNFWAGGILSLSLIAYFIRDWRYLQLAISIPLLFLPVFYWLIPESPRWLLSVGRYEEAAVIVTKIAGLNGKRNVKITFSPDEPVKMKSQTATSPTNDIIETKRASTGECLVRESTQKTDKEINRNVRNSSEEDVISVHDSGNKSKTEERRRENSRQAMISSNSYFELFNGYKMSLVTSVMCITWFVTSFSYYGLSLNVGRIAGDPYLNFFLSGLIEIPSHFLAIGIVVWFGRRWPICSFLLITGIASVALSFIPKEAATGEDLTVVIVTAAMVGKFAIVIAYAIVCLYATEIFPTVVRNKGIGLVSISARVGALLASLALLLLEHGMLFGRRLSMFTWTLQETTLTKAPMILFGTVAILPSMLVLLLPEMKLRQQPQTIAELEAIFAEDKQRRKSSNLEREMSPKSAESHINKGFIKGEQDPSA